MLMLIGGMVGYTILLQGLHFMPIGKLQWFKVCSWAMVMHVMVIGYFITSYGLERIRYIKRIFIPSSLIAVSSLAGFIFITNSEVNPIGYFKNRYHIGNYIPGDSFLCEAQRSMPVGFKAINNQHFFLIPWYKNFKSAYHNNQPFTGYVIRKPATDLYFQYPPLPSPALHWDYRLTDLSKGIILTQNETIVHRINSIVLVKVISLKWFKIYIRRHKSALHHITCFAIFAQNFMHA